MSTVGLLSPAVDAAPSCTPGGVGAWRAAIYLRGAERYLVPIQALETEEIWEIVGLMPRSHKDALARLDALITTAGEHRVAYQARDRAGACTAIP